jgi:acyl-coenzyme A thioesterase PaaI-like protein
MSAIQDLYPDDYSHCYGCGRLNAHGLHIKTEWTGEEGVARFMPRPEHIAIPGFVYGGLIASLIDCHGIATAAAASMHAAGKTPGRDPSPRFVTAVLEVVYLKPTPVATELVIRGRPVKIEERKVIVEATISANGVDTVRGTVVAAPLPASMASRKPAT